MNGDCSKDSQSQVSWALTTNNDALYYNGQDQTFSSEPTEGGTKEQAYTLTISGNGEMHDYTINDTPWGTAIQKKLESTASVSSYASPHITRIVFADNSNISRIGTHAFRSTSIKEIDIPDSVTSIGNYAMIGCRMLENIKIGGSTNTTATDTKPFYVQNGVLYENYTEGGKRGVELRFYPLARTEAFVIPDGVTVIGANSLQLGKMNAVTFPDSVRSINSYSFSSCKNLTSIALPNNVQFGSEREINVNVTNKHDDTYRGAGAFGNTENLREVTNFPNVEILPYEIDGFPVTEIADNAFGKEYYLLTSIAIGKNVTKIGERAFHDGIEESTGKHSQLTSVVFNPGADIEVGARAFQKFVTSTFTVDAGERNITLKDRVFLGDINITKFNMPNLQKTGYGIFYSAADKTSIVINGNADYDEKAFLNYTGSQGNPSLSLNQATVYAVGENVSDVVKAIPEKDNNILCVLNGGKIADLNAEVASTTKLLTPIRSGYKFAGWYSDESFATPLEGAAKKTTYYAKWTKGSSSSSFDTSNLSSYFTYNINSGLQGKTEIPLGEQIAIADLSF